MDLINKIINKFVGPYLLEKTENKMLVQSQEMLEIKRRMKKMNGEKINVVFVCHRIQVWDAIRSAVEACIEDELFDVTIVTIPNKIQDPKLGMNHENYASEGAEEFFKDFPCRVLQGYDYEKKTWLDLRTLEPDYLFFQTGYNIARPPEYQSGMVAMYTKLCYMHYGMPFMEGYIIDESYPRDFLKHTYFHFAEFPEMRRDYLWRVAENPVHKHERVVVTGYPKLDGVEKYIGCESESWQHKGEDRRFRAIWAPRWSTDEDNCTFFEYKDKILDYVERHPKMEFLFRPHPQAFAEYIQKKEMTPEQVDAYKGRYTDLENASIDQQRAYLPSFYSADLLIADETSLMPEFFLTGKPVIYTYKIPHLNGFAKQVAEGFYWAKNWEELVKIMDQLLRGDDPLKEKRQQIIKEAYYLPKRGAGYEIKECLKKDFLR